MALITACFRLSIRPGPSSQSKKKKTAEVQGTTFNGGLNFPSAQTTNPRERSASLCPLPFECSLGRDIQLNWERPSQPVVPSKIREVHARIDMIDVDRIGSNGGVPWRASLRLEGSDHEILLVVESRCCSTTRPSMNSNGQMTPPEESAATITSS